MTRMTGVNPPVIRHIIFSISHHVASTASNMATIFSGGVSA
jgi:hypothetical protein